MGRIPRAVITRFRDPKSGEYTHPEQNRTISIREAARLQGFPNWFAFHSARSSQYDQVGNAVPVQLAHAIAKEVKNCLRGVPTDRLTAPFRRRPVTYIGTHGELRELNNLISTPMELTNDGASPGPSGTSSRNSGLERRPHVSEWFGHRVFPTVSDSVAALHDQKTRRSRSCPNLLIKTRHARKVRALMASAPSAPGAIRNGKTGSFAPTVHWMIVFWPCSSGGFMVSRQMHLYWSGTHLSSMT